MIDIELPTLTAAMALSGPRGMCFHRAIALCLDLPESILCVAILRAATEEERKEHPEFSTVPFYHAWVEWGDNVLAPSTIERFGGRLVPMNPREYYRLNGADNIRSVDHGMVKRFCDDIIMSHLLLGTPTPHGYLVDRLFGAVGFKYKTSEQGGVIPL